MPIVKICGITRPQDAEDAFSLGADFLGLVFAPSARRVTKEKARSIVETVPTFRNFVGVFQNEDFNIVCETAGELGLEYVQLHGAEDPDYCRRLTESGFSVLKAFPVTSPLTRKDIDAFSVFAFLFDSGASGRSGGSGKTFRWSLVDPDVWKSGRGFLSGGLGPENIDAAIDATHPYGVDVSSGVELTPGVKDFSRMREFIRRAKQELRSA